MSEDPRSIRLLAAPRLVYGGGRYLDDLDEGGALHVAFVRSPYPHARILAIDTAEARAVPGVRCVLTGSDVPNILFGRAFRDVPILAVEKVRFAGEMVAALQGVFGSYTEQPVF